MVARPCVFAWISNDTGFDRIEMDVSQAGDEVAVYVDEPGPIAPLERVAGGAKLSMTVSGVAHGDALHEFAERLIMDLHERMKMISHPAERVQSRKTAVQALSDDIVQYIPISRRCE
jgi:hypothetical protein